MPVTNSGGIELGLDVQDSYRIRNISEVLLKNKVLPGALMTLKDNFEALGAKVEENLNGMNWYFVPDDFKIPAQTLGQVFVPNSRFKSLNEVDQAKFFLKNALIFEILRSGRSFKTSDSKLIESVTSLLTQDVVSSETLLPLLLTEPVFAKIERSWIYELIESPLTEKLGGVLILRHNLRFLVTFCDEESISEIRARQAEISATSNFKGAQVLLTKLAFSQKCQPLNGQQEVYYTLIARNILPLYQESFWISGYAAAREFLSVNNFVKKIKWAGDQKVSTLPGTIWKNYQAKENDVVTLIPQDPKVTFVKAWEPSSNKKDELTELSQSGKSQSIYTAELPILQYKTSLQLGLEQLQNLGFLGSIQLQRGLK